MRSLGWLQRPGAQSAMVVQHGYESRFDGSTADLIEAAASVSLVTRGGHEVQVGRIERSNVTTWSGTVLRVAAGGTPRVGDRVELDESHVHSGILRATCEVPLTDMSPAERPLAEYYVLDTLADDIESLEQIVPRVQDAALHWESGDPPGAFDRTRIITAISALILDDFVAALASHPDRSELVDMGPRQVPTDFDASWFRITSRGRHLHQAWVEPPLRDIDPDKVGPDANP